MLVENKIILKIYSSMQKVLHHKREWNNTENMSTVVEISTSNW